MLKPKRLQPFLFCGLVASVHFIIGYSILDIFKRDKLLCNTQSVHLILRAKRVYELLRLYSWPYAFISLLFKFKLNKK